MIRRTFTKLLTLLLCGVTALPAFAQSDDRREVVIHRVLPFENTRDANGEAALALRVLYSVQNARAQSVEAADSIQGASLRLAPERVFTAPSKDEPIGEGAWNIVLLTDLSDAGTQDDSKNLMRARKDLAIGLEGLQDGNYAWFDFNTALIERQEKFKPLKPQQDPSAKDGGDKKDDSIPALLAKPATAPLKPVCLNRALFDAINKVKEVPGGRKAVIVFTHQSDGCPSLSSRDEVIRAARAEKDDGQQVQIFAIGLGNDALKRELTELTTDTGGAAIVSDINGIVPAIRSLSDLIAGQREATFVLYPRKKGPQTGVYRVLLADTTSKDVELTFASAIDYAAPPSLVYNRFASVPDGLRIFFSTISRDKIRNFSLRLIDPATAKPVLELNQPGTSLTCNADNICYITIPNKDRGGVVQNGASYELQGFFEVRDNERRAIFEEANQAVTAQYTLQPPVFEIRTLAPAPERRSFVITVTADVDQTVADVYLVSAAQTGSEGPVSSRVSVVLDKDTPKQVVIPAGELPDGGYLARVEWEGSPGTGQNSAPMQLDSESAYDRLVREAQGSTNVRLLLIAIGALALMSIVGLILYFRSRMVTQVKSVRGEINENQRMRKINIDAAGQSGRKSNAPDFTRPAQDAAAQHSNPRPADPSPPATAQPRADTIPAASLKLLKPEGVAFKGRVKKSPFTLGRDASNDGVLPVDAGSGVSRRHATLIYQNNAWHVRDEGTANGVRVNGVRIAPNQLVSLSDGALFALGNAEIEFRVTG